MRYNLNGLDFDISKSKNPTLKELCLQFRYWNNMSQETLAKLCGVARQTLWRAEKGVEISERLEKQIRKVVNHNNGL